MSDATRPVRQSILRWLLFGAAMTIACGGDDGGGTTVGASAGTTCVGAACSGSTSTSAGSTDTGGGGGSSEGGTTMAAGDSTTMPADGGGGSSSSGMMDQCVDTCGACFMCTYDTTCQQQHSACSVDPSCSVALICVRDCIEGDGDVAACVAGCNCPTDGSFPDLFSCSTDVCVNNGSCPALSC